MFQLTNLESRIAQIQATDSPDERNELLRELEPYVRRIASRVCKRVVTVQDDEYMIAFRAVDEAIDNYNPYHRTSFSSFAYQLMHHRLVDYFRQEQRYRGNVSIFPTQVSEGEIYHSEVAAFSYANHEKEKTDQLRRSEIEVFTQSLQRYGISLGDLVKNSPKHQDTREELLEIAKRMVAERKLLIHFYQHPKADKQLAQALGIHRRTLNRHRTYLLALTILVVEDLSLLRGYVGL